MAGQQGRDVILKRGNGASPEVFTAIAGATSTGLSLSNGEVDITTNDEDGVKTLLAGKYGMAGSTSLTGIAKDEATFAGVRTDFLAGTIGNYQLVIPGATGGGTWSFAAAISSLEETGEMDGALTYSISLNSSGALSFV
jgi:TP901-1 family phage major tail protein